MTIDPSTGQVKEEKMPEEAEFPSVDFRHVGRRYRQIITLAGTPSESTLWLNQVQRRDLETGTIDRHHFGPDVILEEHILVPDLAKGTEGEGWVIGTALDLKKKATMISVFDAMALHDGPMAQAYLPYALPLGLHGTFHRLTI
jgi:carotenoid cleavage dioxygenase